MQGKKTGEKGSNNTGEPPKEWTKEEEQALRDAHEVFGDSWGAILKSKRFKGIFAGRVDYMLRVRGFFFSLLITVLFLSITLTEPFIFIF
jgi:hypothetical protein